MKKGGKKPPKSNIDNVYTVSYNKDSRLRFSWDPKKNRANFKKHSVWFDEAQTVWTDPLAVEFFDSRNSQDEDRFIRIGRSHRPKLLLVVFCEMQDEQLIRIISARPVAPKERKDYEEGI
ncbi:MAG: BrnT family toxin [Bdellovibrionota bacterium]